MLILHELDVVLLRPVRLEAQTILQRIFQRTESVVRWNLLRKEHLIPFASRFESRYHFRCFVSRRRDLHGLEIGHPEVLRVERFGE